MTSISEIIKQLQVLNAINLKDTSLPSLIKELLVSTNIQSSYYLSRLLKIAEIQDLQMVEDIVNKKLPLIGQITVLAIIYRYIKKSNKSLNVWRDVFLKERSQSMFQKFNEWAVGHSRSEDIFSYFLHLLVCQLPLALSALNIHPSQHEFESYLIWISYFEVKTREQHVSICQIVKQIKDAKLVNTPDYEHKGHLMLRKVIELLGTEQRKKGSLYMLFEPGSIRQKDIQYFCNVYQHLLEDLDQVYLCNIFVSLTHNGINKEVLSFIDMVTRLLLNGEQFYTLRYLYQNYILPVLAYQFKSHRKIFKSIFDIVLFYVAGFLSHCKLDNTAISCLIDGLQHVDPQIQRQWGQLGLVACKDDNQLKESTKKKLALIKLGSLSESGLNQWIQQNKKVWRVTMRNGRKLKKYPQIDSVKYRGLVNRYNDCYIISSIQALFVTQELPSMIQKIRKDRKGETVLLDQIYDLFYSLKNKDQTATIKYLKQFGPEMFKGSNNQEDVQEYLLSLFQQFEEELKMTPQGLALFEQIFKIEYSCKFVCQSCGETWKKQRNEHTYIYSFRHNEVFDFQGSGKIEGYPCRKCKKEDLLEKTSIINQPKLLILHINRFSHKDGVSKKNLGNKPIMRTIGKYRLVGFISHRGANISAGHYLFYGLIGNNRWAIFDDIRVGQFQVQEDEEFEREFRSENTPYILFYRLHQ